MTKIKEILQKIGTGILYGIGIGISAGILNTLISQYFWIKNIMEGNEASKKLVITEHRDIHRNNNIYIFGTLENKTNEYIRSFKIEADFYDSNGTFIEKCDHYISTFPRTKKYNFKISCDSCKDKKPFDYQSYKVYVTEGII